MADKKIDFKLVQITGYHTNGKGQVSYANGIDLETKQEIAIGRNGFKGYNFLKALSDPESNSYAKANAVVCFADLTQKNETFFTANTYRIVSSNIEEEKIVTGATKLFMTSSEMSFAAVLDSQSQEQVVSSRYNELPKIVYDALQTEPEVQGVNAKRGVLVRFLAQVGQGAQAKVINNSLEIINSKLPVAEFNQRYTSKLKEIINSYKSNVLEQGAQGTLEVVGINLIQLNNHPRAFEAFQKQGENLKIGDQVAYTSAALRLTENKTTKAIRGNKLTILPPNKPHLDQIGYVADHFVGKRTLPLVIDKPIEAAIKKPQKPKTKPVKQAVEVNDSKPTVSNPNKVVSQSKGYPVKIEDIVTSDGSLSQFKVIVDAANFSTHRNRLEEVRNIEQGHYLGTGNPVELVFDIENKSAVESKLSDLAGTPAIYTQKGIFAEQETLFVYGRLTEEPFKTELDSILSTYNGRKTAGFYAFPHSQSAAIMTELSPFLSIPSKNTIEAAPARPVTATSTKKPQKKSFKKGDFSDFYRWQDNEFGTDPNKLFEALDRAGYIAAAADKAGIDWSKSKDNVYFSGPDDSLIIKGKDLILKDGKKSTKNAVLLRSQLIPRRGIPSDIKDIGAYTVGITITFSSRSTEVLPVTYSSMRNLGYGTAFDLYLNRSNKQVYRPPTEDEKAKEQKRVEKAKQKLEDDKLSQKNAIKKMNAEWNAVQEGFHKAGYVVKKGIHEVADQIEIKHGAWGDNKYDVYPLFDKHGQFAQLQRLFEKKFVDDKGEETTNKLIGKDIPYDDPETGENKGIHTVLGYSELENQEKPIMFVEGLADGSTTFKGTGNPTVVCVDKSNMIKIVGLYRERYPERKLVIVSDNDVIRDKKTDDGNVGVKAAIEASFQHKAQYIIPDFTGLDLTKRPSDINDIEAMAGLERVKQIFNDPNSYIDPPKNIGYYVVEKLKYEGLDTFDNKREEAVDLLLKAYPTQSEMALRELIDSNVSRPLPIQERNRIAIEKSKAEAETAQKPKEKVEPTPITTSAFEIEYKMVSKKGAPNQKHFVFLDHGNNAELIESEIDKLDGQFRRNPTYPNVYYVPARYGYNLASRLSDKTGAPKAYLSKVSSGEHKGQIIVKGNIEALETLEKGLNEVPTVYDIENDGIVILDPFIARMTQVEREEMINGEKAVKTMPVVSILEYKFKDLFEIKHQNQQEIDSLNRKKPLLNDDFVGQLAAIDEEFNVKPTTVQQAYFSLLSKGVTHPREEYLSTALYVNAYKDLVKEFPTAVAQDKALHRVIEQAPAWIEKLEGKHPILGTDKVIADFEITVSTFSRYFELQEEIKQAEVRRAEAETVTDEDEAELIEFSKDHSRISDLIELLDIAVENGVYDAMDFVEDYLKASGSPYLTERGDLNTVQLRNDVQTLENFTHDLWPSGLKASNIEEAFEQKYIPKMEERTSQFAQWIKEYQSTVGSEESKTFKRYFLGKGAKSIESVNPYVIDGEEDKELMKEELSYMFDVTTPRRYLLKQNLEMLEANDVEEVVDNKKYEYNDGNYSTYNQVEVNGVDYHQIGFNNNGELRTYYAHTPDSAKQVVNRLGESLEVLNSIKLVRNGLAQKMASENGIESLLNDPKLHESQLIKNETVLDNNIAMYGASLHGEKLFTVTHGNQNLYTTSENSANEHYNFVISDLNSNQLANELLLQVDKVKVKEHELHDVKLLNADSEVVAQAYAVTVEGISALKASDNPIETFGKEPSLLQGEELKRLEGNEVLTKFTLPSGLGMMYRIIDSDQEHHLYTNYMAALQKFAVSEKAYAKPDITLDAASITAKQISDAINNEAQTTEKLATNVAEKIALPESAIKELQKEIDDRDAELVVDKQLPKQSSQWDQFVEFVTDSIKSEIDYADFFSEAFKQEGSLFLQNPYYNDETGKVDNKSIRDEFKARGYKNLNAMYSAYQEVFADEIDKSNKLSTLLPDSFDATTLGQKNEFRTLFDVLNENGEIEPQILVPLTNFVNKTAALQPLHPIFAVNISELSTQESLDLFSKEAYLLAADVHGIVDITSTETKEKIAQKITAQWEIRKSLAGMTTRDIEELGPALIEEYARKFNIATVSNAKSNAKTINKHLKALKHHSASKIANYNYIKHVMANEKANNAIPTFVYKDVARIIDAPTQYLEKAGELNAQRILASDMRKNRLNVLLNEISVFPESIRKLSSTTYSDKPILVGQDGDSIKPGAFTYQSVDSKNPNIKDMLLPESVNFMHFLNDSTVALPVALPNDQLVELGLTPISDDAVSKALSPAVEFAHRFGYVGFEKTFKHEGVDYTQLVYAELTDKNKVKVTKLTIKPEYKVSTSISKSFENMISQFSGEINKFLDLDGMIEDYRQYMPKDLLELINQVDELKYKIQNADEQSLESILADKRIVPVLTTLDAIELDSEGNTNDSITASTVLSALEMMSDDILLGDYWDTIASGKTVDELDIDLHQEMINDVADIFNSLEVSENKAPVISKETVEEFYETGSDIDTEAVKNAETAALADLTQEDLTSLGGAKGELVKESIAIALDSSEKQIDNEMQSLSSILLNEAKADAESTLTSASNVKEKTKAELDLHSLIGHIGYNAVTHDSVVVTGVKESQLIVKPAWSYRLSRVQDSVEVGVLQIEDFSPLIDKEKGIPYVSMGLSEYSETQKSKSPSPFMLQQLQASTPESLKNLLDASNPENVKSLAITYGMNEYFLPSSDLEQCKIDLVDRIEALSQLMQYDALEKAGESPSLHNYEKLKAVTGKETTIEMLEWMNSVRKETVLNVASNNYVQEDFYAEQYGYVVDNHFGSGEEYTIDHADLNIVAPHEYIEAIHTKSLYEIFNALNGEDKVAKISAEHLILDQIGTLKLDQQLLDDLEQSNVTVEYEQGRPLFYLNGEKLTNFDYVKRRLANNTSAYSHLEEGQTIAFETNDKFEYGEVLAVELTPTGVTLEVTGQKNPVTFNNPTDYTLVSEHSVVRAKEELIASESEKINSFLARLESNRSDNAIPENKIALIELTNEYNALQSIIGQHEAYDLLIGAGGTTTLVEAETLKPIAEVVGEAQLEDAIVTNTMVKLNEKNNDPEPDPDNDPTPRSDSTEPSSELSAEAISEPSRQQRTRSSGPSLGAESREDYDSDNGETEGSQSREELHSQPSTSGEDQITSIEGGITDDSSQGRGLEYELPEGYEVHSIGSFNQRLENNIEALKVRATLLQEEREATVEEKSVLAKYVGWGGLSPVFNEHNWRYRSHLTQIKEILTPEEIKAAKQSSLTAYYTPEDVSRGMWDLVEKFSEELGFDEPKVGDPCTGSGNFLGTMPNSIAEGASVSAFEIDVVSADIAGMLYGKDIVKAKPFEEVVYPNGYFDLLISNVPFGDSRPHDRQYNKNKHLIHDYFISKMLDLTREGGIVPVLTSNGTLDKENDKARREIAKKATLIGAIRLPNGTYNKIAGTTVGSDLLIFQKDKNSDPEPAWLKTSEITVPRKDRHNNQSGYEILRVNDYFSLNSNLVIGQMLAQEDQYGKYSLHVEMDENVNLRKQINLLGSNFYLDSKLNLQSSDNTENAQLEEQVVNEYSNQNVLIDQLVIDNNKLSKVVQYWDSEQEEYVKGTAPYHPVGKTDKAKEKELSLLLDFVDLRELTAEMLDTQSSELSSDELIQSQIEQLNNKYDAFVKEYGILNKQGNARLINQDPTAARVMGLVNYDKDSKTETKLDIFSERVLNPDLSLDKVETTKQALIASVSGRGKIDIDFSAELLGVSKKEFIQLAEGEIYKNPKSGEYELAELYLSGDVKEKLNLAKQMVESVPEYSANVTALESVIPRDIEAKDIYVQPNSPWLPVNIVRQFANYVITGEDSEEIPHWIDIDKEGTLWGVQISDYKLKEHKNNSQNLYGTERYNAAQCIDAILNNKQVTIRDTDSNGSTYKNTKQTALANQRVAKIKDLFQQWVWSKEDRAKDLARRYNDKHNRYVIPKYDGKEIKYHGLSDTYKGKPFAPREHQKAAVLRYLLEGDVLLAHSVGTGKTLSLISIALEGKYAGKHSKPLLTVPNNVLSQISNAITQHYPKANALVLDPKTFNAKGRKELTAQIAYGNWDVVVIPHSMTQKLSVSPQFQTEIMENQLFELEEAHERVSQSHAFTGHDSRRIRKQIEKLEAKIKDLTDTGRKDDVMYLDSLGVDALLVDEADNFLNLLNATNMGHIKGVNNSSSQRAMDMLSWVRHIQSSNRGGVVFATGTDIRNTIGDIYTNAKFLAPDLLEAAGVSSHDEFMGVFGKVITAIELNPEGTGFSLQTRLAEYDNLPEMLHLYRCFADVVVADDVDMDLPEHNQIMVDIPSNEWFKTFMNDLAQEAKDVRNKGQGNMLAVMGKGIKGSVDLRLMNNGVPQFEDSKIETLVKILVKEYHEGTEDKLTSLAFLDTGVNTKPFNAYDTIIGRLVEEGIPRDEIIDSRKLTTPTAKVDFENGMNEGRYRIGLVSTERGGVGNNIQDRLKALIDVDPTWRTRELSQRLGRGLRQGNMNETLNHYRLAQVGSFDYFMFQTLQRKARFIDQIKTDPSVATRSISEDVGADFRELMALSTDNPKIKESIELRTSVESDRLDLENKRYQVADAKRAIGRIKDYIESAENNIEQTKLTLSNLNFDKGVNIMNMGEVPLPDENPKAFENYKKNIIKGINQIIKNNGNKYPKVIELGEAFDQRLLLIRDKDNKKAFDLVLKDSDGHSHHINGRSYKGTMFDVLHSLSDSLVNTHKNKIEYLQGKIQRFEDDLVAEGKVLTLPDYQEDKLYEQAETLAESEAQLAVLEQEVQEELSQNAGEEMLTLDEMVENYQIDNGLEVTRPTIEEFELH